MVTFIKIFVFINTSYIVALTIKKSVKSTLSSVLGEWFQLRCKTFSTVIRKYYLLFTINTWLLFRYTCTCKIKGIYFVNIMEINKKIIVKVKPRMLRDKWFKARALKQHFNRFIEVPRVSMFWKYWKCSFPTISHH